MTEILDRIEEELVAAARRRATAPTPGRRPRRARAPRRTLALAGAGVLLLAGGAVAAVTTGREAEEVPPSVDREIEDAEFSGALPGGVRVALTVGEAPDRSTVVAYESDRGGGVRGSEALCTVVLSTDAPSESGLLATPCQGPWPLSQGAGLQSAPIIGLASASIGRDRSAGYVTFGFLAPDVLRADLVLTDESRRTAQLSRPFTVELAGNALDTVPGAPRDVPPPGGAVSARLLAAATAEPPEAAVLTYADGRTERVPLGGG